MPDAANLLPEVICQPSKDGDGSPTPILQDSLARDTSEVSSEMVIEPPERDDVLEHYVFKCFGAYQKMMSAYNTTATVINKHWAKKSQILVHPNKLKQAEFRDGRTGQLPRWAWRKSCGCPSAPAASRGRPGSTRSPTRCSNARPTSSWLGGCHTSHVLHTCDAAPSLAIGVTDV